MHAVRMPRCAEVPFNHAAHCRLHQYVWTSHRRLWLACSTRLVSSHCSYLLVPVACTPHTSLQHVQYCCVCHAAAVELTRSRP